MPWIFDDGQILPFGFDMADSMNEGGRLSGFDAWAMAAQAGPSASMQAAMALLNSGGFPALHQPFHPDEPFPWSSDTPTIDEVVVLASPRQGEAGNAELMRFLAEFQNAYWMLDGDAWGLSGNDADFASAYSDVAMLSTALNPSLTGLNVQFIWFGGRAFEHVVDRHSELDSTQGGFFSGLLGDQRLFNSLVVAPALATGEAFVGARGEIPVNATLPFPVGTTGFWDGNPSVQTSNVTVIMRPLFPGSGIYGVHTVYPRS